MTNLFESSSKYLHIPPHIILYVCGLLLTYIAYLFFNLCKYGKIKHVPKDVVLIFGTPSGTTIPSPSPYVLKLETYMRMANIPYQINTNFIRSREGKVPWMLYNGLEIADSQVCMEYLNKKLSIDFNRHLTEREKALAHAFRLMIEKHLIWPFIMMRFIFGTKEQFFGQIHLSPSKKFCYSLLWPYYQWMFAKKTRKDGIGFRTRSQVYEIASKDLDAISSILGNKSYFMGEQFSEIDATIFGFLSQLLWTLPEDDPIKQKLQGEWTNLTAYCVRMKKRFWPDWETRIKTGKNVISS